MKLDAPTLAVAWIASFTLVACARPEEPMTESKPAPPSPPIEAPLSPVALPTRAGPKPRTTPTNPHTQLDQIAPAALQDKLAAYMFGRPCVDERPSIISVPGARAMWLRESCSANADRTAFIMEREHAHLHPPSDGSLHLALPPALAEEAIAKGWAELHPVARRGLVPKTIVMVFGPRDEAELAVVCRLVDASFGFAHGADPGPTAPRGD